MLTNNTSGNGVSKKSQKPLMEKKRRARINRALQEMKSLVMDATHKEAYTKLEKADILEMTVLHLQKQRETFQTAVLSARRAGYYECALEVGRLINSQGPHTLEVVHRLPAHLGSCLRQLPGVLQVPVTHSQFATTNSIHATTSAHHRHHSKDTEDLNSSISISPAPVDTSSCSAADKKMGMWRPW